MKHSDCVHTADTEHSMFFSHQSEQFLSHFTNNNSSPRLFIFRWTREFQRQPIPRDRCDCSLKTIHFKNKDYKLPVLNPSFEKMGVEGSECYQNCEILLKPPDSFEINNNFFFFNLSTFLPLISFFSGLCHGFC